MFVKSIRTSRGDWPLMKSTMTSSKRRNIRFSYDATVMFLVLIVCLSVLPTVTFCNEITSTNESSVPGNGSCIIGRLRLCADDEDCVENAAPAPHVKVMVTSMNSNNRNTQSILNSSTLISKPSSILYGTCVCRNVTSCKRTQHEQSRQFAPKFNPMIDDGPAYDEHHSNSTHHSSVGWIFGSMSVILALGSISFLVYYYGFRYGMISYYARQLGFIDNTQVEHQLLNRVSTEDGGELHI